MTKKLVDAIDDLLPQTQCGLCGYGACRPYADALVEKNEAINLCPPGGLRTLTALATLLQKDPQPMWEDMIQKSKPPSVALIREDACIGCTKCIQACPVDAIIGSAKQMHTVITDECTGCELCIAPCPVDCIDMVIVSERNENLQQQKSLLAQKRFQFRQRRLRLQQELQVIKHHAAKNNSNANDMISARRTAIKDAVNRVKQKKTLYES
jgi:electron transport complex protein RnfB